MIQGSNDQGTYYALTYSYGTKEGDFESASSEDFRVYRLQWRVISLIDCLIDWGLVGIAECVVIHLTHVASSSASVAKRSEAVRDITCSSFVSHAARPSAWVA